MRTTLDLDKPVLDGLKALQKNRHRSLSKLASQLLAEALAREQIQSKPSPALAWKSRPMQARVDLADKDAVYRVLDQP